MYNVKSLETDSQQEIALAAVAEQFRDNIWTIVDNWMLRLATEEGSHNWHHVPEAQLVGNLPALLTGVAKLIEDPSHIIDFEPGGLIFAAASEQGVNRRAINYEPSELLREQELLRNIVWSFSRKHFKIYTTFELERRINKALNKITSVITESYIKSYASELIYHTHYDKITGFLNYDSFKKVLDDELKRSKRYRHSFSLMLLEVDDFDEYTGAYGHVSTNALAHAVAAVVAQAIRSVDIPVRFNDSRFAIILPETPAKLARKVAERLRKTIKTETRHEARVRDLLKRPLTISVGVSTYQKGNETAKNLIVVAGKALRAAKRSGDIVV